MNFVSMSYGFAALAFALLATLAAFSWRGRAEGLRVPVVCVVVACWAFSAAINAVFQNTSLGAIFIPELVRDIALLWFVFGIAGSAIPTWLRRGSYTLAVLLLLFGVVTALSASDGIAIAGWFGMGQISGAQLLGRAGLLFAFIGLVALEQAFRNSRAGDRYSLKYFVFGLGAIFAYDLFLYSQVELLGGIRSDSWLARGIVDACAAPLIAIAIRRSPTLSLDIFISRQVVFYSGAFFAVGIYLMVVAIGGYYVRIVGGTWGGIAQVFFLCGAVAVLATTLFSQSMRRRAQVFIAKHFYRNKYDYRIVWLRFVETLSNGDHAADPNATALQAVAQTMNSPGGILFRLDDDQREYSPVTAWPSDSSLMKSVAAVPVNDEIIQTLGRRQWIIDLKEYARSPDVYQNIALPSWLDSNANFRILSPILELDRLTGFIVLRESNPAFDLTYEDRDLLKTLGRHIATSLAQHESSRKLAESRQFDAYNRLTAFMMHDLKNSVAQLNLIVVNAKKHKSNPEFIDDTIETIANTADRITRLIEQLRGDAQGTQARRVDLGEVTTAAVRRCADRSPHPRIEGEFPRFLVRADRDRLQAALEHVIRNAQDATPAQGAVTVSVRSAGAQAQLAIADTGAGMDLQFIRERLFRPFDTTKGSKGMGIGAYQVREYMRSMGGDVEVSSSPGQGTVFTLSFNTVVEEDT